MSTEKSEELQMTLVHCLSQQIDEIELLLSMYPKNDEVIFTNSDIIEDIKAFLKTKTEYVPNHIDFVLNLFVGGCKLEISINLPSFYPNEDPDVYIRCNKLNRQQETHINFELSQFIRNNHTGELCLFSIISWIQNNDIEVLESLNITKDVQDDIVDIQSNESFVRLWIFSHHIYNKKKREEIVKLAKEYSLTGFCLPGKPGIICVEGSDIDCKEWWKIIKSLNWKKIVIRKSEIFKISEACVERKFYNFEEKHFQSSSKNSKHADMSEFTKFIEKLGLSHALNEVFGIYNT